MEREPDSFDIDFKGVTYRVVYMERIIIFNIDNVFGDYFIIPEQFSNRLYRYPEEKLKQFIIMYLPHIFNFISSVQDIASIYVLNNDEYEPYENDKRVIEFFEDILSSLHPQTKSARK